MATYSALYIPADIFEEMETVELERGLQPIYTKLEVNLIEPLFTGNPDIRIIADEEGRHLAEPQPNERAAAVQIDQLLRAGYSITPASVPFVYGNVLITGGFDEEGNTQSLSQKDEEYIRNYIREITTDSDE
ncbi:hypothetical protein AB0O14_19200 [Microbacterium foliorum]|uniref:DUF3846 domain-containing protein n=1 Tax=Rothia terrae TaxID=396015 RepID=UPI00341FFFAB